MTSRVRQVAPIRKEAPLGLAIKAPQDLPQVPAGAGHHNQDDEALENMMGAQGHNDDKVGLRRLMSRTGEGTGNSRRSTRWYSGLGGVCRYQHHHQHDDHQAVSAQLGTSSVCI